MFAGPAIVLPSTGAFPLAVLMSSLFPTGVLYPLT